MAPGRPPDREARSRGPPPPSPYRRWPDGRRRRREGKRRRSPSSESSAPLHLRAARMRQPGPGPMARPGGPGPPESQARGKSRRGAGRANRPPPQRSPREVPTRRAHGSFRSANRPRARPDRARASPRPQLRAGSGPSPHRPPRRSFLRSSPVRARARSEYPRYDPQPRSSGRRRRRRSSRPRSGAPIRPGSPLLHCRFREAGADRVGPEPGARTPMPHPPAKLGGERDPLPSGSRDLPPPRRSAESMRRRAVPQSPREAAPRGCRQPPSAVPTRWAVPPVTHCRTLAASLRPPPTRQSQPQSRVPGGEGRRPDLHTRLRAPAAKANGPRLRWRVRPRATRSPRPADAIATRGAARSRAAGRSFRRSRAYIRAPTPQAAPVPTGFAPTGLSRQRQNDGREAKSIVGGRLNARMPRLTPPPDEQALPANAAGLAPAQSRASPDEPPRTL